MLNLKKLKKSKFSLVESVLTYRDMAKALFVPSLKMSLLSMIFIFLGQSVLSFLPHSHIANICFWVWTIFVIIVATTSFFKTAEDIILDKKPHVYENISYILLLSTKLFAVIAIIAGAVALLITPMLFLKNPLFALPYKSLVIIFLIAVAPFIYFAPLAVVLREADILNSFYFSYYMVLSRWGKVAKAMLGQIIFTAMIVFWLYFLICVIVFPHSADFFNFMFTKATALEMQSRSLYPSFILWEALQIVAFTMMTAIFTGANTVFFMYLEGTLFKLVKGKVKFQVNPMKPTPLNVKVNFVEVLTGAKSVNINTSAEQEEQTPEEPEEVDDGYSEYQNQGNFSMSDLFEGDSSDVEIMDDVEQEVQGNQEKSFQDNEGSTQEESTEEVHQEDKEEQTQQEEQDQEENTKRISKRKKKRRRRNNN